MNPSRLRLVQSEELKGRWLSNGRPEVILAEIADLDPDDPLRAAKRAELVGLCLAYVRAIARRYAHRAEPLEDIEQAGMVGLMKAVNRFDPEIGDSFLSYASPFVSGEIKRHFRDTTWAVRVTRRLQELRGALQKTTAEFTQVHGRSPTVEEFAVLLDATEEEVLDALQASNAYSPFSLDMLISVEASSTLGDLLGYEEVRFDHLVNFDAVQRLIEELPARERTILLLRFWGNLTQSETAERLGISQMHVSRLLNRTLVALRTALAEDPPVPVDDPVSEWAPRTGPSPEAPGR